MRQLSRRSFAGGVLAGAIGAAIEPPSLGATPSQAGNQACTPATGQLQPILPGIWKARLGTPEVVTPIAQRRFETAGSKLAAMPAAVLPAELLVQGCATRRGYEITLPLQASELVYGLGLQMHSTLQRGTKKTLRVNADPRSDTGDSHAPVPFYVTTGGYGVFIDTARYATFYCGSSRLRKDHKSDPAPGNAPADPRNRFADAASVRIEIPGANGADIYIFGGPSMLHAVERYNLFSGGGPRVPEWGLGFWYRCDLNTNAEQLVEIAKEFRDRKIPCDVLGLEPGWQTHAYSCSFLWDAKKFPDPAATLQTLKDVGYRVNLWEHAYTHPTSPIYTALGPYSADYEVWDGAVPDFALPEARKIFGDHHTREFLAKGVSGFKLDECDNSDFTGSWSFPETSRFPNGADGEQMHSMFGLRYQDTILDAYDRAGQQTYGLVRSSGSLAAPYPFVLYSDLYDHRVFIRALVNSGFSGLLWCPEVRDAESNEDLIRRLQSVVFSPLAMVNGWYIKNPPWKQFRKPENNAGQFATGWEQVEAQCREILGWRMQMVPYLRAAFADYVSKGTPPFRALALDWPHDPSLSMIDDEYLLGDRMLVAPVFAGQTSREVVLPPGRWCDYWTGAAVNGGSRFTVPTPLDRIPVYVKSGSILPIAEIGPSAKSPESRRLTVRVYSDGSLPFVIRDEAEALLQISWDSPSGAGNFHSAPTEAYVVTRWQTMGQV